MWESITYCTSTVQSWGNWLHTVYFYSTVMGELITYCNSTVVMGELIAYCVLLQYSHGGIDYILCTSTVQSWGNWLHTVYYSAVMGELITYVYYSTVIRNWLHTMYFYSTVMGELITYYVLLQYSHGGIDYILCTTVVMGELITYVYYSTVIRELITYCVLYILCTTVQSWGNWLQHTLWKWDRADQQLHLFSTCR